MSDQKLAFEEVIPKLWLAKTQVGWFPCYCLAIQGPVSWLVYGVGVDLCEAFVKQFGADAKVSHFIIPNSFHHLGIPEWSQAFPDAVHVSARAAIERLIRQGRDKVKLWNEVELPLPEGISIIETPHCKMGELWMRLYPDTPERTLCVADAFFCLDSPKDLQGRIIQTMSGITKRPAVSRLFKWAALNDRKAYYAWATQIINELDPQVLIPQHGQVLRGNQVTARLQEALDLRF